MDKNRIYTVKEIARLLGFSTNTVYKYLDEGKIKATRLGKDGRFRIPQKEVVKLLGLEGEKPQIASSLKPEESQNLEAERELEEIQLRPNLKPRSIMPYFLTITTALFLLLVTIAVGNIKLSEARSSQLASTVTVPAARPVVSPEVKPEATRAAMLKSQTVLVTIDEASSSAIVNVRQKPTTNSEKIGKAKDGDTFEFVSFVSVGSGWYGVKLPDGSTGFISAIYIKKGDTNN